MENNNKLSWAVPAYNHSKKSIDWFWALGLIVLVGAITSFIFDNYFFSILLVLGGILMGHFANEEPETLYYELNEKGLTIKDRIYPFKAIKSYYINTEKNPTLFIKTDRFFLPVIPVAINLNVAQKINEIFEKEGIEVEEMSEGPIEQIMDMIGY